MIIEYSHEKRLQSFPNKTIARAGKHRLALFETDDGIHAFCGHSHSTFVSLSKEIWCWLTTLPNLITDSKLFLSCAMFTGVT